MRAATTWDTHPHPPPGRLSGSRSHQLGNTLKTAILLAGLTALLLALGQRLGGTRGLLYAGVGVAVMNFVSYWFSDRIALAMHGARPLDEGEAPWLYEMVGRLAGRAGMPRPKLYLVNVPTPN